MDGERWSESRDDRLGGQRLVELDVGGTKVAVAALEPTGLTEPEVRLTTNSRGEALLEELVAAARAAGPVDAVGVAVPSVVDWPPGGAASR